MAEAAKAQAPVVKRMDMSEKALARPAGSMETIRSLFAHPSVEMRISSVIPKHLTPERLLKVIVSSIAKTPKLLECTQISLLQAAIAMGELGLEPDATRGLAYLVPYKTTCQLVIGYRGLVELARRTGRISRIRSVVAYEKDKLAIREGLEPSIEHEPNLSGDRGKPVLVYAVAHFDEGIQFDWMTVEEIEAVRKRSRAANAGPWVSDWGEMAKKTVIRRLCKLLPMSPELAKAIEVDDAQFTQATSTALATAPPMLDIVEGTSYDATTGIVDEPATEPTTAADAPVPAEATPEEQALEKALTDALAAIAGATSIQTLRATLERVMALPDPERQAASKMYEVRMGELNGGAA